jgi:transposase
MIIPTPSRIVVALDPVDFRKQIDGLAAACEQLGEEPLDGTLVLFRNRRRNALKALVWTDGGFTLAYKRLEQGRFRWPEADGSKVRMTRAELAALLEGLDLSNATRLSRWKPKNQRDTPPFEG